ncbi:hypothetical protein [Candidatus Palauibacter sp.]|uniref:hypothetical protein n=1 Tax=Candidatus Palauibacter sp. TaxID=3101350 RepID=UPI003B01EE09
MRNRVFRSMGSPRFLVTHPDGFVENDLALAGDEHDGSDEVAAFHRFVVQAERALEYRAGHAHVLRLAVGEGLRLLRRQRRRPKRRQVGRMTATAKPRRRRERR